MLRLVRVIAVTAALVVVPVSMPTVDAAPVPQAAVAPAAAMQASAVDLPWSTRGTGRRTMLRAAGPGWWRVTPEALPGLQLLAATRVRDRLYELQFSSPYLSGIQTARILLPEGYDRGTRRYPSLYLLHGCCNGATPGGARNWTDALGAEAATEDVPAIVVMPDGGAGGMYVDWFDGSWHYESFIIGQLLPWVDEHLRTIPRREKRAVAGVSMGGFGAMYYATRHPDLFSSQGSFSGIVDLLRPEGESSSFVEGFIVPFQALATGPDSVPTEVFGDLVQHAVVWHGHNPADMALNLVGNNRPPFLTYGDPPIDPIEATAALENHALEDSLRAVGIEPLVERTPAGSHTDDLWIPALRRWMDIVTAAWAAPLPPPRRFSYTSTRPVFSVYDYDVRIDRPVDEFATIADVARRSFTITGSGLATVTTAQRYLPGGRYAVSLDGDQELMRADSEGRLEVHIPLGASATVDQFAPEDSGTARPTATVQVEITRITS